MHGVVALHVPEPYRRHSAPKGIPQAFSQAEDCMGYFAERPATRRKSGKVPPYPAIRHGQAKVIGGNPSKPIPKNGRCGLCSGLGIFDGSQAYIEQIPLLRGIYESLRGIGRDDLFLGTNKKRQGIALSLHVFRPWVIILMKSRSCGYPWLPSLAAFIDPSMSVWK